MKVPFNNLSLQNLKFYTRYEKELQKIVAKSEFVLGEYLEKFEDEFAKYLNVKNCVGVASGTDALTLILLAIGIKPGDEVIVPAFTFAASVSPILMLGAKPVLVDIKENSPLINTKEVEKSITKKTKAILFVDLYGLICDVEKLSKIAKKNKLFLIEDACQAHGSTFKKMKAGSLADFAFFSFYPGKNLGAWGDAGAVVTNSSHFAETIKMLRDHGQKGKYKHLLLGTNSRLDSIQAVILSLKLKHLDKWNKKRQKIAMLYRQKLSSIPELKMVVYNRENIVTNNHLFVVLSTKRDKLIKFLYRQNIQCLIHYPVPIHRQKAFGSLEYGKGSFPNSEKIARECISLPIFPELDINEVEYVSDNIVKFYISNVQE